MQNVPTLEVIIVQVCRPETPVYLDCCDIKNQSIIQSRLPSNYLYISLQVLIEAAYKIVSTKALSNKFIVMGLMAIIYTLVHTIYNFIYWDPLSLRTSTNPYKICILSNIFCIWCNTIRRYDRRRIFNSNG